MAEDLIFFSVIIPTYNRADFILNTVNSLLDQTYANFEIIVVDDGSTDETEKIIFSVKNEKLKYYKKENGERGAARNFGANLAKGEYLNFFDSDDLAYSNHLEEASKAIKEMKKPQIFHLSYDIITPEGKKLSDGPMEKFYVNDELIRENFLSCNGVFIRRDIFMDHPFPEDRRMAVAEDWALWLILASRYDILNVPIITSAIIAHDQRSIKDYNTEKIIQRDKLLIEYLRSDKKFMKKYGKRFNYFIADRYTYFTLLLALQKKKKETISYLLKAFKSDIFVIFRKRFLASVKHLVLS